MADSGNVPTYNDSNECVILFIFDIEMKSIAERLQSKNKERKSVDSLRLGAFIVQLVKKYAEFDQEEIQGYIRWNKLFLRLGKKENKHRWFVKKGGIMESVNEKLEEFGYEYRLKEVVLR